MSDRMLRQFMEMVQIDSESGNEAQFLEYLRDEVTAVGGKAAFDDYGNLIATFEAKGCEGVEPILLVLPRRHGEAGCRHRAGARRRRHPLQR